MRFANQLYKSIARRDSVFVSFRKTITDRIAAEKKRKKERMRKLQGVGISLGTLIKAVSSGHGTFKFEQGAIKGAEFRSVCSKILWSLN